MARLKNVSQRLKPVEPRIGAVGKSKAAERIRDRNRRAEQPGRSLYSEKAYQELREQVFARDGYKCVKTGVMVVGGKHAPNSAVLDHIVDHKGDRELFFDPANCQTVSKRWHDAVKQSLTRGGLGAAHRPNWLRPSVVPLTMVCGAPGSGKSTYVDKHKSPGDTVICLDSLVAELFNCDPHGWDREQCLGPALYARNDMLAALSMRGGVVGSAWFIISAAAGRDRAWWLRKLKPVQIVVLKPRLSVCVERLKADNRPDIDAAAIAAYEWHRNYSRLPDAARFEEQTINA